MPQANMPKHPAASLRRSAIAVAAAVAATVTLGACGDEKPTLDIVIDPENTPTMLTHEVSTLISDSGITRYHLTSPVWFVFGEAREPRWKFPQGVFLEKFDNDLRQEATVEADSATYFERKKIWRLDGNVRIKNLQNEKFLTQQLFWDQRQQKIYSDSFIHIERADRVIEGFGFESDDRLNVYEVKQVSGIFPVSHFAPGGSASTAEESSGDTSKATSEADSTRSRNPRPLGPARIVGHPGSDSTATAPGAPHAPGDTSVRSPRRRAIDLRHSRRRNNDTIAMPR